MQLKADILDYSKRHLIVIIPFLYPSWNEIQRMDRFTRTKAKKKFMGEVICILKPYADPPFAKPVRILVDIYFPKKRRRDNDNYGGKWLIDAIVQAGIIPDDSTKWIPGPLDIQIIDDEGQHKIMLQIEDV